MNYTLMRLLDKYVGTLLCFIIYFTKFFRQTPTYVCKKKILIIKLWGLGSIILASPTIKAIRDKFPKSKITFLTLGRNKGLYEESGLFDEIVYFKLNKVMDAFPNFFKTIINLRKQKFDLAIDLDVFTMFAPLLLSLSNVKMKIGHDTGKIGKSLLYEKTIVYNNKQHISDSFFDLVRYFGIENKPEIVKIIIQKFDKKYVDNLLVKKGIKKSDKIIGINVNASDFGTARRWSPQNFAKLADKIIQDYNSILIFIGAKEDKQLVSQTIKLMKNKKVLDFSGKTNIKQLAYLIQRFNLLITNDSGPMHIAVAMNTSVIAFFGPETPLIYGPLGDKHTTFYKHLFCSPCLSVYNAKRINCKHNAKCMKLITVDEVMEKVGNYLE